MSKPVVLEIAKWNPSAIKYMAPKVNDRGGKSINIISSQTSRSLHISTPLMMTWGIADFIDEKGESDGKYSMSLNFPNDEYATPQTREFLQKLKDLENQILDDAVKNSDLWWGEEMSREVCKHTFFPFLKYSKNKDTKKTDYSKPPSIRAKVPYYDGKWNVEIYDTKFDLLFPCENPNLTPVDFVPKQSQVACVLQCGGLWIGGKGWGLTWKLIQGVVKPREVVSVFGKCHIKLSPEEQTIIENQKLDEDDMEENQAPVAAPARTVAKVASTHVEDSDDEAAESVPQSIPIDEPVAPAEEPAVESKPVVKKVVKKATPVAEEAAPAAEAEEAPKKKKVVKKA
jgi:hypothetical protein